MLAAAAAACCRQAARRAAADPVRVAAVVAVGAAVGAQGSRLIGVI